MKCVLSLVCVASAFHQVDGHAYMSWPSSRNFDKCDLWDPQSLNGHCANCNTDCCGRFGGLDFAQVAHSPTGIYQAGGVLEVELILTAHHMGYMELRICSRPDDLTQECFDEHLLVRDAETAEMDPAPIDENHPGRWYIPPQQRNWPTDAQLAPVENLCSGVARKRSDWTRYRWKVRLPADLECNHCVVQWFWVSGNSCSPVGSRDYFEKSSTESWIASKFGGDASAWWGSAKSTCPADAGDPRTHGNGAEKFWNCADIKVIGCSGPSCTTAAPATATTTVPPVTTVTSTTENAVATTSNGPTQAPKGLNSGDTVFLKTRSGKGNHIDVEGVAVQARWESHGAWQAIKIEKESSGVVYSGDVVYLKAHTGAHIDVLDGVVQARWNDAGSWQAMTIEKRIGSGAILPDDVVCLKAHTLKNLDVEDDVVRARWNECEDWQAMKIEKEVVGALHTGDSIHLLAHTGNRVEVDGTVVMARWSEPGLWQTFTIETYGGRAIYSGDAVFLRAHTGALLHVQDTAVAAVWEEKGAWQTFTVQRKDGSGPVLPGDSLYLRAHTGRFVEVSGNAVQANWWEIGQWQTLVVERSAFRRLTEQKNVAIKFGQEPEPEEPSNFFLV